MRRCVDGVVAAMLLTAGMNVAYAGERGDTGPGPDPGIIPARVAFSTEISFTATDKAGSSLTIDKGYVSSRVGELAKNADLSRFIL